MNVLQMQKRYTELCGYYSEGCMTVAEYEEFLELGWQLNDLEVAGLL